MANYCYTFTPNAFSQPSIVSAGSDGLSVTAPAGFRLIPWSEIREVRLSFEPTRFDCQRFLCRLVLKRGVPVTILSTTCHGIGRFELQAAEYRRIMREIHAQLHLAHGKSVVCVTGVGKFRYWLNVTVAIVALILLVPILVVAGAAYLGPLVIIQLIVMAAALPWVWKWIRSNRPATYDPSAIPAGLLPEEPAAGDAAIATPPPLPVRPPGPPPHPVISQPPVTAPPSTGFLPPRRPRPTIDDYGPIAEPGDHSWCSVGGSTTHWADAERYLAEDLEKWEQEEKARADAERSGKTPGKAG